MKKYIVYITLLSILEICLALYITEWRHTFWDYVQNKNFHGFCVQIGVFIVVALLFCLVSAYAGYFITMCAIKWRKKLNKKAFQIISNVENRNQRIQEDCRDYPELMLTVLFGFGKAVAYIVVFSIFLIVNFNAVYLIIILVYTSIATVVAQKIAKPLLALNYSTQRAEATYRNDINKVNFQNCIEIMTGMAIKTKRLAYFQTFYGQIAVVLPILIVAPAYFGSTLTLGALMQATGLMATITENLSFGITSFNMINRLASCRKRLKELGVFDK